LNVAFLFLPIIDGRPSYLPIPMTCLTLRIVAIRFWQIVEVLLLQYIFDFCRLIACPDAASYVVMISFMTIASYSQALKNRKQLSTKSRYIIEGALVHMWVPVITPLLSASLIRVYNPFTQNEWIRWKQITLSNTSPQNKRFNLYTVNQNCLINGLNTSMTHLTHFLENPIWSIISLRYTQSNLSYALLISN